MAMTKDMVQRVTRMVRAIGNTKTEKHLTHNAKVWMSDMTTIEVGLALGMASYTMPEDVLKALWVVTQQVRGEFITVDHKSAANVMETDNAGYVIGSGDYWFRETEYREQDAAAEIIKGSEVFAGKMEEKRGELHTALEDVLKSMGGKQVKPVISTIGERVLPPAADYDMDVRSNEPNLPVSDFDADAYPEMPVVPQEPAAPVQLQPSEPVVEDKPIEGESWYAKCNRNVGNCWSNNN